MRSVGHYRDAPPGVRQQIDALANACREFVGENLIAIYLHGSLSLGCFNPEHGDLDVLAVVQTALGFEQRARLIEFLLACSGKPIPIEITFLTTAELRPWRYPTPFDFHYSEKWRAHYAETPSGLISSQSDEDLAAHITLIHQCGIRLYGPSPSIVLPKVPRKHFESSLIADFAWASERLDQNPRRVLDMCRAYFQLSVNTIASKDEAAEWCLTILPTDIQAVVQEALDVYRGEREVNQTSASNLMHFRDVLSERLRAAGY